MKSFYSALLTILMLPSLHADEIKIYIWDAFLSDKIIQQFTQKTGHTVSLHYFDSEIERNAMLLNGQANIFDLIIMDHQRAKDFGKLSKLNTIDQLKIDNLQHHSRNSLESCGDYGVPYAKGSMGIIHRSSISVEKIDSWYNLLNPPQEHLGGTVMLKDDIDTTAIALLALGLDPFTEDKADLQKSYQLLSKQSNLILQYSYPISYLTQSGKRPPLSLSFAYSGDLFNIKALTGHDDWEFVIPKEGTLLFVDCFSLPSEMPIKQATINFLSFLNDPVIAAENAQDVWFATTNESAVTLTSKTYQEDSELVETKEQLQNSYQYKPLSDKGTILRNKMISTLSVKE